MKNAKKIMYGAVLLLLMSCTTTSSVRDENEGWPLVLRAYAGVNKGGITENTNLEELENAEVDGFTGATSGGFNVGAHALLPVGRNHIESGIDFMYNGQSFTYKDQVSGFAGDRNIQTTQLMVPLTFNFGMFRQRIDEGLFRLKVGYVMQYNFPMIRDEGSRLPGYSVHRFSGGMTIGFETTLFQLSNGNDLGLSLDLYRGSQVYEDYYNQSAFETPGSSYFKAGVVYQFNNQ